MEPVETRYATSSWAGASTVAVGLKLLLPSSAQSAAVPPRHSWVMICTPPTGLGWEPVNLLDVHAAREGDRPHDGAEREEETAAGRVHG